MSSTSKDFLIGKLDALKAVKDLPSLLPIRATGLFQTNNPVSFILEIAKSLISWEAFRREISTFIVSNVIPLNSKIKLKLKRAFKEYFSCEYDDVLTEELFLNGVNIPYEFLDIFSLLKTNPSGEQAPLVYLNKSDDLNYIINRVLTNKQEHIWKDILLINYKLTEVVEGVQYNDIINIKPHENFQGKKSTEFIFTLIDSLDYFNVNTFNATVIDNLFGNIFKKKSIENKLLFNRLIDKLLEEHNEIDNSYYDFSQEEIHNMNNDLNYKTNNNYIYESCQGKYAEIDINDIISFGESENGVYNENIINSKFNLLFAQPSEGLQNEEIRIGLLELFVNYVRNIIYALSQIILSPKTMLIFFLYSKLFGQKVNSKSLKGFFLKNIRFFTLIIKETIMPLIIDFVINMILKELKNILIENAAKKQQEKIKYYQIQIKTLLGLNF